MDQISKFFVGWEQLPHGSIGWLWWFMSAIVFSFGINVLSAYSKPYTDHWLEKYFKSQKEKNDKYRKMIQTSAQDMFNSEQSATQAAIEVASNLSSARLWVAILLVVNAQYTFTFVPSMAIPVLALVLSACTYMSLVGMKRVGTHTEILREQGHLLEKENADLSKKVEEKKLLTKQLEQGLKRQKIKVERKRKLIKLYKEWEENTKNTDSPL